MNRNISMVVTFVAGVAVGVVAAYKVAEQKYSNIANDEIESVIERFSNRQPMDKSKEVVEATDTKVEEKLVTESKSNIFEYREAIDRFNYDRVSTEKSKPKKDQNKEEVAEEMKQATVDNAHIYVISPDEFNTRYGFSTETLYYSSDNFVLDSDYQVMSDSDIQHTIGHDPYGHFGEYEDDSVCVRNEELMCDYEILLSMKTCNEIRED